MTSGNFLENQLAKCHTLQAVSSQSGTTIFHTYTFLDCTILHLEQHSASQAEWLEYAIHLTPLTSVTVFQMHLHHSVLPLLQL